ncbi:hypothetical protein KI387_029198, partial [Taxus chinensis]
FGKKIINLQTGKPGTPVQAPEMGTARTQHGYVPKYTKEMSRVRSDSLLWERRKQLSYEKAESRFSDHQPVSAIFTRDVEALSQRKLKRKSK